MRENFTSATKNIMSKRVAFKCSNPDCRKQTVGPNFIDDKATIIGVAAHISAASVGGPRYNSDLTTEQRISLDNGIWLCQNCATLIDKDWEKYPPEILLDWKIKAEDEAYSDLLSANKQNTNQRPIIEAELIWSGTTQRANGLSNKNSDIFKDVIPISHSIWDFTLSWIFEINIYNNSTIPCFNIELIQDEKNINNLIVESLPKVNNLQPFHVITLNLKFRKEFVGNSKEAQEICSVKFPDEIQNLKFLCIYYDEKREKYKTEFIINGNEIINKLG